MSHALACAGAVLAVPSEAGVGFLYRLSVGTLPPQGTTRDPSYCDRALCLHGMCGERMCAGCVNWIMVSDEEGT